MNIEELDIEIARFLVTDTPEVLVISGKWGVGKTFVWDRNLKSAAGSNKVVFKQYAYLSLFGLGNLNELKSAVWKNSRSVSDLAASQPINTIAAALKNLREMRKSGTNFLASATKIIKIDSEMMIEHLGAMTIRNQIVCFDDLERKSKSLELSDVLGYASYLKEQKGCKVVLLLNDEQLGDTEGVFRTQLEKVADVELKLSPSPPEAASIGLTSKAPYEEELKANMIALGISNIRTIKKTERMSARLLRSLEGLDKRVAVEALKNLALFLYSKLHPSEAPNMDEIKKFNRYSGLFDAQDRPNGARPELLSLFGAIAFIWRSNFSNHISDYVLTGFLDEAGIRESALKYEAELQLGDKHVAYREAWQLFHGSLENNTVEVMAALVGAIRAMPEAVSPGDLDGSIGLIRQLGWDGDYDRLVQIYVDARNEEKPFWDITSANHSRALSDPTVIEAFNTTFASFADEIRLEDALQTLSESWDENLVKFVASKSLDEFVAAYKKLSTGGGQSLKWAIQGGLRQRGVTSESGFIEKIAGLVVAALSQIAAESKLNELRLARYGITPTAPPT